MELLILPLAGAFISLLCSLTTVSIIRVNRGAKANPAWILIASGFLLLGIDFAIIFLGMLTIIPYLGVIFSVVPLVGLLLVLSGLLYWRSLLKKLVK
jgi:hypothetical protein